MPKVQMQGRSTATQALVTWSVDSPDWAGTLAPVPVTDVVIGTRGRTSGGVAVPILNTLLEPSTATLTAGVPVLISGRTSRPAASVAVVFAGFSGSASLTNGGLRWSIVAVPALSGAQTCTATATDAANGSTSVSTLTKTVGAAVTFPAGLSPSVWFDGRQQAYSDLAGTVPISAGQVRRINEASPLTSNWTPPTDSERPIREPHGVRLYLEGVAGGHELTRPAVGGIAQNNCTFVFSFVARDQSYAGPVAALFRESTTAAGIRCGSNQIWVYNSGGNVFTSLALKNGARNTIIVRYSGTTIDVMLDADGTITTQTFTGQTIPATALPGDFQIGVDGGGYLYGSVPQAMVFPSSLSDSQRDSLRAWVVAQAHPAAYPLDRDLLSWVGDSITRSTAASYGSCFASKCLAAARAAGFSVENSNTAIGGWGLSNMFTAPTPYTRALPFYDAIRAKNIMIIALGTNDLANNNSTDLVLNGVGTSGQGGLYPLCDAARAVGYKVLVCTIGPRSNAMTVTQATYNSRRAIVNNDIAANWAAHADGFADTRGVLHWGADGDSDDSTYYSTDKVHPNDAGHAVVWPTIYAAVATLLAA